MAKTEGNLGRPYKKFGWELDDVNVDHGDVGDSF